MPSSGFLALFCTVLLSQLGIIATQQADDNASGGRTVDFSVKDFGRITCPAGKGFKCGYFKDDYTEIVAGEEDGGRVSVAMSTATGKTNHVWANTDSIVAALVLNDCLKDKCNVRCTFGCMCTKDERGEEDCDAGSPSPDEVAPIDEPPAVCPEAINTEVCPLMLEAVPAGNIGKYDCFNFCNGTFASTCDFGGNCGNYDCGVDRELTNGMANGIVVGCTRAHLQGETTADGTAANGSTSSGYGQWSLFPSCFLLVHLLAQLLA